MGIDMLFKWIEDMVSQANATNIRHHHFQGPEGKWKHCIALEKLGWEFLGFEPVPEENSDAVMAKWRKEDKEIKFRLEFPDQCVWLEYHRRRGNEK